MKNKFLLSSVPLVCLVSSLALVSKGQHEEFKQVDMVYFNDTYNVNVSDSKLVFDEIDNIKILGNYKKIEDSLIQSIRKDKDSIYVLYDLNLKDNLKDRFEYSKYNVLISYFANNEYRNDFYVSNEGDSTILKEDINSFINEKLQKAIKEKNEFRFETSLQTESTTEMKTIYRNSYRNENKPYGFVDIDYTANKARVNDISSLWLIETKSSFTPGSIAIQFGKKGYENFNNARQYLKIVATQPLNEVGYNQIRYGGIPDFKEAYPKNGPSGRMVIVSSYSNNAHIGYSTENGLEIGLGTSWEYSQTYEISEPRLSAQKDPDDVQKYTWLYNYASGRSETNNVTNGYIFEQNNSGHDLFENDIAFNIEFKFWVTKKTGTFVEADLVSFSGENPCTYVYFLKK